MKKPTTKGARLRRPPEAAPRDNFASVTRAVGTAALAAKLPLIGDGIAAFLGAMFPSAFERRTEAWLREAQQAINELRRRGVNVEALRDNEQFADLVLTATQAAMRTRSEEKRRALRNAIVNAGRGKAPREIKQQMFVRFVEEFTELHLRLLALLGDPAGWCEAHKKTLPHIVGGTMEKVAKLAFDDFTENRSLYNIATRDLHARGLTDLTQLNDGGMVNAPEKARTSDLGAEFLRFICEAPDA